MAQCTLLSAALTLDPDASSQLCAELQNTLAPEELTFDSLMTSNTMKRAVWNNEYFRFFHPAMYRESSKHGWGPVPNHVRSLEPEEDFLRWNGVKGHGGLSHYLNQYFKHTFINKETGYEIVRPGNAPLVVRLKFYNRAEDMRFYRDLFHFTLRLLRPEPVEFSYRCVAVVSLRPSVEGHDTLRLYNSDASLFRPQDGKFPWSNAWQLVKDANRSKYMLYFIRTDVLPTDPPPIPQSLTVRRAEHLAVLDSAAADVLRKARDAQGPRVPARNDDEGGTTDYRPPSSNPSSPPYHSVGGPSTALLARFSDSGIIPTSSGPPAPDYGNLGPRLLLIAGISGILARILRPPVPAACNFPDPEGGDSSPDVFAGNWSPAGSYTVVILD
ncbi:hypothetical protein MFIFM68171_05527 [Madurella fahalii]|uniref:Uncharacterized protein n=1 Tax=Madurella fahalii TaxID=1157608 RepID=A0ABQ0GC30_9PEZI